MRCERIQQAHAFYLGIPLLSEFGNNRLDIVDRLVPIDPFFWGEICAQLAVAQYGLMHYILESGRTTVKPNLVT